MTPRNFCSLSDVRRGLVHFAVDRPVARFLRVAIILMIVQALDLAAYGTYLALEASVQIVLAAPAAFVMVPAR